MQAAQDIALTIIKWPSRSKKTFVSPVRFAFAPVVLCLNTHQQPMFKGSFTYYVIYFRQFLELNWS